MVGIKKRHPEMINVSRSKSGWSLKSHFIAVMFSFAVVLLIKGINFNQKSNSEHMMMKAKYQDALKYWGVCLWDWNPAGNLRSLDRVFNRLDFISVNATDGDDWDVLWSIEYPYLEKREEVFDPVFKPLRKHQRVNHFPGFNYITDKSFMTTRNRDIKRILPGFSFPRMIEEFKEYVKANPKARFVEKGLSNRGIRLVEKHEIKYERSNKYYQLFMEKPFLVGGRFMDFSTYLMVSSVNPLRLYRFIPEIHVRFCPKPYYPFDPKDLDKYVISDSRIIFLEHPDLRDYYYKYGYSFKDSMEDYMQKQGHNVTELWRKIDETIVKLVLNNEKNIIYETLKHYNSTHHFFELFRVDFLLNEDLEPHLTEVNMSPGMTPNAEIAQVTAPYFEQMSFDTLNLIGAATKTELMSVYNSTSDAMFSTLKNIGVKPGVCVDHDCDRNCNLPECELCSPCLAQADLDAMRRAYRENTRRGGFKRLFPSKIYYDDDFISTVSPRNQISLKWFKEKCQEANEWC